MNNIKWHSLLRESDWRNFCWRETLVMNPCMVTQDTVFLHEQLAVFMFVTPYLAVALPPYPRYFKTVAR